MLRQDEDRANARGQPLHNICEEQRAPSVRMAKFMKHKKPSLKMTIQFVKGKGQYTKILAMNKRLE